jgi:hypothetical protein
MAEPLKRKEGRKKSKGKGVNENEKEGRKAERKRFGPE